MDFMDHCKSNLPVENRTIAFMQVYSALSTCRDFSFSTCSWKIRMWSMKANILSAAMGAAWSPAAASSGAKCSGILHWDAFKTNNSDQESRSRATWSLTGNSGKPRMKVICYSCFLHKRKLMCFYYILNFVNII